ncbi:MAG: hypothetical protein P4L90_25700 [Rhodopila sp.]|nr:hypothetical protein [Rhodopila sp.]
MPLPITPKPAYPNVPIAPGVPAVPRSGAQTQNHVVAAVADAVSILSAFLGPQWGLFTTTGVSAFAGFTGIVNTLLSDLGIGGQSVADLEYRQDSRISTAPQEQGAFLSYNKVALPFSGRVTYVLSGAEALRGAFLQQVKAVQASLTLLNLVMPEYTYLNCNVVHHDFRRVSRRGVTMFAVDIWVEEVRITGTTAYSNTQTASGANQVDGGTVQPQNLTAAQNANVAGQESVFPAGGLT